MSESLNSLKEVGKGIIQGTTIRVIKGDARSLGYSSYGALWIFTWRGRGNFLKSRDPTIDRNVL